MKQTIILIILELETLGMLAEMHLIIKYIVMSITRH